MPISLIWRVHDQFVAKMLFERMVQYVCRAFNSFGEQTGYFIQEEDISCKNAPHLTFAATVAVLIYLRNHYIFQ